MAATRTESARWLDRNVAARISGLYVIIQLGAHGGCCSNLAARISCKPLSAPVRRARAGVGACRRLPEVILHLDRTQNHAGRTITPPWHRPWSMPPPPSACAANVPCRRACPELIYNDSGVKWTRSGAPPWHACKQPPTRCSEPSALPEALLLTPACSHPPAVGDRAGQ